MRPRSARRWAWRASWPDRSLCFSVLEARPVVHEILIAIFVTLTTPVTLMLLARAALHRDRTEGSRDVPAVEEAENLIPPGKG